MTEYLSKLLSKALGYALVAWWGASIGELWRSQGGKELDLNTWMTQSAFEWFIILTLFISVIAFAFDNLHYVRPRKFSVSLQAALRILLDSMAKILPFSIVWWLGGDIAYYDPAVFRSGMPIISSFAFLISMLVIFSAFMLTGDLILWFAESKPVKQSDTIDKQKNDAMTRLELDSSEETTPNQERDVIKILGRIQAIQTERVAK